MPSFKKKRDFSDGKLRQPINPRGAHHVLSSVDGQAIDQLILTLEVVVEARLTEADLSRQAPERRAGNSSFCNQLKARLKDFARTLGLILQDASEPSTT